MALVDALLDKITNGSLRRALREQVDQLLSKQSYGLVFQQHKPETVELHSYAVRRNCKVRIKSEGDDLYLVDAVKNGMATIRSMVDEPEYWNVDIGDLVVVREFGDPIYAGLRSTGTVTRGDGKRPHIVINAENFHALEALLYTHEKQVDAIYIDPPYNTRDKDWKYNNDYVDSDDVYRHSKWLAMMQRRLELAGRLLKPDNSVLILTIDENEVHRVGLLLEQTFKGAAVQMVSSITNPKGTARTGYFSRTDEFLYFVFFGTATIPNRSLGGGPKEVRWRYLRRTDVESRRGTVKGGKNQFYPIYVNNSTGTIDYIGEPLSPNVLRSSAPKRKGCTAVFPIRDEDGMEMNWGLTGASLKKALDAGYVRVSATNSDLQPYVFAYLTAPNIKKVEKGDLVRAGQRGDGSWIVMSPSGIQSRPTTTWRELSHETGAYGTSLLRDLLPGRTFPFPKSVYAVEDALRLVVGDKPDATVVDFFAGSGTTAHAVARLNRQDGGSRVSICVTNNEVSHAEAEQLSADGFCPGDPEWESLGICEYVTKPRVVAAFTGQRPDGSPVPNSYTFNDEFPLAEGFEENAEFFNLTYEDPDLVSLGRSFEALAPILWLKAGGQGVRIDKAEKTWALPDGATYGVLFDADTWREFIDAVVGRGSTIRHVFIVTDSDAVFQQILADLPSGVTGTKLYDDYLRTFELNTKGRA